MNHIDGQLTEDLGWYLDSGSASGLVFDDDQLLSFANELDVVAKDLLVTEHEGQSNDFEWEMYGIADEVVFFCCPSGSTDQQVLLKNPIAWKCAEDPEEHHYYATLKTFGLVCSMAALKRLQLELLKKKNSRLGLKGALLGLLGRNLDADISLFSEVIAKTDEALGKHLAKLRHKSDLSEDEVNALEDSFDSIMFIASNSA